MELIILLVFCAAQMALNVWLCMYIVSPPGQKPPKTAPEEPDKAAVAIQKMWDEGLQNLMTYSVSDALRKDVGLEED